MIAGIAAQQPPWSVSTPALAAIAACLADQARELAEAAAEEIAAHRGVPGRAAWPSGGCRSPAGPDAPSCWSTPGRSRTDAAGWLRRRCATEGFAVRRGETFPGLGPDWIRIAVRDPATTDRLAAALDRVRR